MATPKRERNPQPPSTTFHEAVDRYILQGGSDTYLEPILKYLGPKITIGEIDDAMIEKTVQALGGHLQENSARRQIASPIQIVLNHAFDTGRKRGAGKLPARWLTPDEAEKLIDVASNPKRIGLRDPQLRTLQKIVFMLGTGAMPGEVIIVDGKAFNRVTGQWDLPGIPSLVRPRRLLPPSRVAEALGDIPFSGPAFLAPNGHPYKVRKKGGGQMAEAFGLLREAAGLEKEITPATCRTTWAVWLYAQARDMDTLVGLGGWAGPRSAKPLAKLADAGLGQWLIEQGWDFRDSIAQFRRSTP